MEDCGKRFKREKTLVKHFQLIHQGIKEELLCVHCGAQFRSASGLRAHVSVHTGQETVKREVACPHCEKAFRCKADLESHMVVHSRAKPFSCSQCGVAFAQKASLKDHENVHLRKFECKGCAKAFGRERYLKLHMRTCSQLNPEERGEKSVKSTKEEEKAEEEVGGEGSVQHILISSVPTGVGGGGGEADMVQVVQMQHQQVLTHCQFKKVQKHGSCSSHIAHIALTLFKTYFLQVLHHLPPGLQLMVEGEQVHTSLYQHLNLLTLDPLPGDPGARGGLPACDSDPSKH